MEDDDYDEFYCCLCEDELYCTKREYEEHLKKHKKNIGLLK